MGWFDYIDVLKNERKQTDILGETEAKHVPYK